MDKEGIKRSDNPIDVEDPFSSGAVTATGERIFVPLRKRSKVDNEQLLSDNGTTAYTDLKAISVLSEDEIKLIRMQYRITVEGDDIVGPILQFQNIGLNEVFLQKLRERNITVSFLTLFHFSDSKTCSNARNSVDS